MRWILTGWMLGTTAGCLLLPGGRPGDVPAAVETPVEVRTVVDGRVERSTHGDLYRDRRYAFSVRGPAAWRAQVNVLEPRVRVQFLEAAENGAGDCRIRVYVAGDPVSAEGPAWDLEHLERDLRQRGRLFYLDELDGIGRLGEPVYVATVHRQDPVVAEIGYYFNWRAAPLAVVGEFPADRVTSCKPHLDAVVRSVRPVGGSTAGSPSSGSR